MVTQLTVDEINHFFPVIQLSSNGSELRQITAQQQTVGTGVNGLAVGWRRTITTSRPMPDSAPDRLIEPNQRSG